MSKKPFQVAAACQCQEEGCATTATMHGHGAQVETPPFKWSEQRGNVEFSHGKWWKIAESHKILQLFFGWLKHVKTCFLWAFIHNGMFFAAFSTGFYAGSVTPEALTLIQGHQCSLRSSNAATNKKNPTCQRPLRSVLNKCWDSWKSYSYIMLHIVYWDPHSRNDT